ncbi:MAG: hypothetical protein JOZ33_10200 [Acidobacteriaceae bacterium]|nr:hypothetical protein [Acidobacteriaceae bacterium]
MLRNRKNAHFTVLQQSRYKLLVLLICISWVTPFSASAQKAPGSNTAPATTKACDGNLPGQTSAQQNPSEHQSSTGDGTDRLKLSTKADRENPDPQGQFCRRERSDQKSLQPSATSDQPESSSEPAQTLTPPIAQVTDGKLTIRANGQEFASVLESVRSATGFTVEMPPGVNSEPVFLNVGPTSTAEALMALLDGTNYNYIIVGSERDPRAVKRLILTDRSSNGTGTLVASSQGAPVPSQPALYGAVQPDSDSDAEPPSPAPMPMQPAAVSSTIPKVNIQKLAAESGKTPGQILDELQKKQEQMLDDQAASQSQSVPQQ